MQKITPFLWFDDQAEAAAKFYVSVFKKAKLGAVTRYGQGGPGKPGSVMTATFQIEGTEFVALNGGPRYELSPATSFVVTCKTQKEIDHYWSKLTKGGSSQRCGWLTDKFGVTWQIVPEGIGDLLETPEAVQALMTMDKLDIARLKAAAPKKKPARSAKAA